MLGTTSFPSQKRCWTLKAPKASNAETRRSSLSIAGVPLRRIVVQQQRTDRWVDRWILTTKQIRASLPIRHFSPFFHKKTPKGRHSHRWAAGRALIVQAAKCLQLHGLVFPVSACATQTSCMSLSMPDVTPLSGGFVCRNDSNIAEIPMVSSSNFT